MKNPPKSFKVGGVMTPRVTQQHIDDSDPCDKENCMLSEGFVDYLTEKFGADKNYKVKSTNHAAGTNSPRPNSPMSGRSQIADSSARTRGLITQCDERRRWGAKIHERWEG
jgi:hypothetical protein